MARFHWTLKLIIGWIIGLSIAYSTLSIIRHNHFQSGGFDLGLYDQAVWQYANFQWPYNTIKDRFILGDHLTLTLPFLAPLFWIWSDVRMLLIFQAFWISFSALAIYKIVLRRGLYEITALCLAVIYSLFYGIQYLVYFDFHPVVIGVGLLAWTAYFLESGKTRWLVVSVVMLLLTQENMGIALASLGFIYLFHKKHRRTAIAFFIGGVGYSLLASKIVASFSPIGFQYWPQISHNPVIIFQQFFDSEEKRQVWWYSLASFSFLPILSPGAMLAVTFDLAQYFVTGPEFSRMWSPFMHHRATLGVYLALGTLDVMVMARHFKEKVMTIYLESKPGFEIFIGIFLVGLTLFFQYYWHLPLNKLVKAEYWKEEQWMADNRTLFAMVPPGAAVATQQNFVPHLSHRNKIYLVWPRVHDFVDKPCGQTSCWWLDFDKRAEYLVVDTRPNQWLTQILESNDHWLEAIGNMEKTGKIKIKEHINDVRLYQVVY
ncbi:MAG: DUF2079 domain-containing protein [Candidatus Gottesmanbacteria bacterium]|nr:DUF2079 domain-containing protein [Candidatus Gottesmanbacteria bacterium]